MTAVHDTSAHCVADLECRTRRFKGGERGREKGVYGVHSSTLFDEYRVLQSQNPPAVVPRLEAFGALPPPGGVATRRKVGHREVGRVNRRPRRAVRLEAAVHTISSLVASFLPSVSRCL